MCICLLVGLPVCLPQAVCVLQVKNWLVSHATSGSHLFCHPPSHCPNGALQAMRLALSLKSHMVTPISFEIIAVFQATWSLLSNYLRNFPGRMQDICKSVPPWSLVKDDRAASYKKDCLACGCCHSNWATCLCLSFIGERNNGLSFPAHFIFNCLFVFFPFSCPASPKLQPVEPCSGKLSLMFREWEAGRNVARSSLWHIVHVTLARCNAAHCAADAHTLLQSCSLHLHCRSC